MIPRLSVLFLVFAFLTGCSILDPRPTEKYIVYDVGPGDSVWKIAQAFNVSSDEIVRVNQISNPRAMKIGTPLRIPYRGQTLSRSAYAQKLGSSTGGQTVTASSSSSASLPTKVASTSTLSNGKPHIGGGSLGPTANKGDVAQVRLSSAARYIGKLDWPVVRAPLSSPFGYRWMTFHEGIDLEAPEGASVRAAHDGTVVYSGDGLRGYGNLIVVRGDNLITVYAHNSRLRARVGQWVNKGDVVAEVGSTGHSTGPHCHFETRIKGSDGRNVAVDPLVFFPS